MSMSLVYHKYMCAMMMNEQNVSMECRHSMNGYIPVTFLLQTNE